MNFWEIALIVYGASILLMWLGFVCLILWGRAYIKENNLNVKKGSTAALVASLIPCVVISLIPLVNVWLGLWLLFSDNPKQALKQKLQGNAV